MNILKELEDAARQRNINQNIIDRYYKFRIDCSVCGGDTGNSCICPKQEPKNNVVKGWFPQNDIKDLYEKLDATLVDFTNDNPMSYATIMGVLEMLKFKLLKEIE